MKEKSPIEIKEMIDSNPVLKLIDVREQWEFDKCHIENSTHIPMGKIPDATAAAVPPDEPPANFS